MPYSKNKRVMALMLSILMTLGLGTSSKKNLFDKDLVPQSIELDYYKNIDPKIIDLDYDSLNRNLDLEDIVYLGICADVIHEYLNRLYSKEIDLRLCTDSNNLSTEELSFLNSFYDDYDNHYLHIVSKLGNLFDSHYDELSNYIDNNKSFSSKIEGTSLSKATFNLPSYGLGNITLIKTVLLDYDIMDINVKYKDFKPYRKYNFIDEDVIKLKEKEQNDNNLPDEYAMLPECLIIDKIKKKGINQYPLKGSGKEKGFKLSYVDKVITNNNSRFVNYPLGTIKKRSGYRGR